MPADEADELLDFLFNHMLKMDFQYHHKWRNNDLVMWDNRCLLHKAGGGYQDPDIRLLHKTVVAGEKAN